MKIKPLPGRVLIEVLPELKETPNGILIGDHDPTPDEQQRAARDPVKPAAVEGIVRAIGDWPKLKCGLAVLPEFHKGSRVFVPFNCGIQMQKRFGRNFRMVRNSEVLAVLG